MVSMKDIAKRCNVSVATVSKALNGYSDIGKAKREEIQAVAKEMGYFPNSSARALKTNRSYDLGILFADNLHSGLFKVTAESKGYDITFTSMNMVANRRMSYYEHCRYRGLDGVVIANIDFTTSEVLELVRSSLPVVTIDFVFDGRVAIVSDNVKGMKDLVDYAVSMGHRKIAGNERSCGLCGKHGTPQDRIYPRRQQFGHQRPSVQLPQNTGRAQHHGSRQLCQGIQIP